MGFAPKFFLIVCSSPLRSLSLRRNTLLRCGNPQSFTRRSKAKFACVRHRQTHCFLCLLLLFPQIFCKSKIFAGALSSPSGFPRAPRLACIESEEVTFGLSALSLSCLELKRGSNLMRSLGSCARFLCGGTLFCSVFIIPVAEAAQTGQGRKGVYRTLRAKTSPVSASIRRAAFSFFPVMPTK